MFKAMVGAVVIAQIAFSAAADVLEVPGQFPTIQAAIDAADNGDDILIAAGTYRELLDGRNKSLTFIGAGAGQTVLSGDLDGDGIADGSILVVNSADADVLPFLTFTGITFRDASIGIMIARAGDVVVAGCDFEMCAYAAMDLGSRYGGFIRDLRISDCHFLGEKSVVQNVSCRDVMIERSEFSGLTQAPISVYCEKFQMFDSEFTDNTGGGIIVDTIGGHIDGCVFERNQGQNDPGRSIYSNSASITAIDILLENCIFQNNGVGVGRYSSDYGALSFAGIMSRQSDNNFSGVTVRNSVFRGNRAPLGSAISPQGTWRIEGCLFTGNLGRVTGPINASTYRSLGWISNCQFIDNGEVMSDGSYEPSGGGGLCVEMYSRVIVEDCLFRGNLAGSAGGVVAVGDCWINRCRFEGNRTRDNVRTEGGAILSKTRLIVTNSAFVGNHADGGWGGAIASRFVPRLDNCLFAGNTGGVGSVLYLYGPPPPTDDKVYPLDIRSCLIVPGPQAENGSFVGGGHDLIIDNEKNLLTMDIRSIGFARAPNDGGDGWGDDPATPDIDEGANDDFGDLTLLPGSPAIDAGRNDLLPRDIDDFDRDGDRDEVLIGGTDLLGQTRFLDDFHTPNAPGRGGYAGPIDFGPVEYQSEPCLADLNHDGALTSADFVVWISAYHARTPECDQDGDGWCNSLDFNAWVANFNAGCP